MLAEYYRYVNNEEVQDKDVILLVDDEVKNVDFVHPRYFKVAYSNMKKHENTSFVGKEVCIFPRLVRKATEKEVELFTKSQKETPKSASKATRKTPQKVGAKKN
ncbi:hypothetical protein CN918_30405 [Priestia megaterium]|nr:hypothetical protein CN918_30405 [Priestia megaterium]